jgi:hypothetical protein
MPSALAQSPQRFCEMDPRKKFKKPKIGFKPSSDQTLWYAGGDCRGVLYLSSPESAFVLGAELIIDGGMATL